MTSVCSEFSPPGSTLQAPCSLAGSPSGLAAEPGQAKAVLTYNIFESAGNVVVQTSGSLNFTGATQSGPFGCSTFNGAIYSNFAAICTGTDALVPTYPITGPGNFNGSGLFPASSVTGIFTALLGTNGVFMIDPAYISNSPIVSSATFNSQTLATLNFTTTGLIGTWSLTGTSETIQVIIGAPAAAVPGPLPLLGAGAAFGWSRRLRKRIATPLITPPQA
ncbi:hypothetical protein KBZ12_17265 [Cyanobium sp. Cruz CV13-4-11]|jgi:hypothetical protein|uniref:hypothetical protein n=1 Tax=unclassified Cyanobium TaxID=2627006 RepID=UPI0020CF038C|nr:MULTISPECIES: hypothetical protein [unclassified Cyanobium]MCP9902322.1 hypothetical protein [Cyanobium sp. Cruz CV11-17]MCP9921192.1 hypothetical protein [Cyanobium sp. Cruz CV13-4-11]